MSQSVSELLGTSMEKVRELVDANTVIGSPMVAGDGVTIIPISKITFGLASGGTDFKSKTPTAAQPFGGGAGCGVKIIPVAFLILQGEHVRLLPIAEPASTTADRVIDQLPELVDKISELVHSRRRSGVSDI